MEQKKKIEYAGNLLEEIQEMDKLMNDENEKFVENTQTRGCTVILTIYCC